MRAILIEEERFTEILDFMTLKANEIAEDSSTMERLGFDKSLWSSAAREVHRMMHYHFVRWAQSHGASCTK